MNFLCLVSIEARLRITNAKKSDEADGRVYSCMAVNSVVNESVVGPEFQIQVNDSMFFFLKSCKNLFN